MTRGLALFMLILAGIVGALLIAHGYYGWTLFVILPFGLGFAGAWVAKAATHKKAILAGMLAAILASLSLLALGVEGLACVIMSWPIAAPLGAFGGSVYYQLRKVENPQAISMLILLPLGTTAYDVTAKPDVFSVHSQIQIAAPAETVWKNVVAFTEITEPREWYFHTGLAYPIRSHIEGSGPGAMRYCEFSTGPFVEPIETWDEPRLLRFTVLKSPAPMHEWSPYGDIHPKHLDGYLISKRGQFKLTALDARHTLLEGTTWYQHSLWPAQYWRWWSDAIIHRIHLRVLRHIKAEAERSSD